MARKGIAQGINISTSSEFICDGCILWKSHRAAIPKLSQSQSSKLLDLVHSDVVGPLEVPSVGVSLYIITFIGDYSKWTSLYTIRRKSEAFECFKRFKAYSEKHTSARLRALHVEESSISGRDCLQSPQVKALRSDNGGEYLSNDFKTFLINAGIQNQLTVAYTPQQNGVAERMNRTLLTLVRSMLHGKNIEKRFWA